ncbi:MAG: cohesin domain-containing protein [bacterium]|nr:cohesin domain-containing protein [bacterium]
MQFFNLNINKYKFLLLGAGLLFLLIIFFATRGKSLPQTQKPLPVPPSPKRVCSLTLSPESGAFEIGKPFTLKIFLDTADIKTSGTDARVIFNSKILEAKEITTGTIYKVYPAKLINNQKGEAVVSGIAPPGTDFSGKGVFAEITFTPKVKGSTKVYFDFANGSTIDSNVAGINRGDILEATGEGMYVIK